MNTISVLYIALIKEINKTTKEIKYMMIFELLKLPSMDTNSSKR